MDDRDPREGFPLKGWPDRETTRVQFVAGLIIVSVLVMAFLLGVCAGRASASGGNGPCDQVRNEPIAVIRCVAERFDVDAQHAIACAADESGLNPTATNGRFSGLYQIGDSEWATWDRPNLWHRWYDERPSVFRLRAHVITALFHVHQAGWSAWTAPSC